jgi:hypothetical protein
MPVQLPSLALLVWGHVYRPSVSEAHDEMAAVTACAF